MAKLPCTKFRELKRIRDNFQREAVEARFKAQRMNIRDAKKHWDERDEKVKELEGLLDGHLATCDECKRDRKTRRTSRKF